MADFSTIVRPSNTSLDLYCNSVTTTAPSANSAYAILSTTTALLPVVVGTPVLINWATSQLQAYKNITISGGDTLFTLGKIGNYQIELNANVDISNGAGEQCGVELLVNGTSTTFDVGFGNNTTSYNYKATLKCLVTKPTSAPVAISFRSSAQGATNGAIRYAQLSIVKLE